MNNLQKAAVISKVAENINQLNNALNDIDHISNSSNANMPNIHISDVGSLSMDIKASKGILQAIRADLRGRLTNEEDTLNKLLNGGR